MRSTIAQSTLVFDTRATDAHLKWNEAAGPRIRFCQSMGLCCPVLIVTSLGRESQSELCVLVDLWDCLS